tara:strand:+ start:750 stop:2255 length:1506 start_codon:yes stop_codon:yes gene_type:complete
MTYLSILEKFKLNLIVLYQKSKIIIDVVYNKIYLKVYNQKTYITYKNKNIDQEIINKSKRAISDIQKGETSEKRDILAKLKVNQALSNPADFGIYNLCELAINLKRHKNINIDDDKWEELYNIIWQKREKGIFSNNHLLNNYRTLLIINKNKKNKKRTNKIIKLICKNLYRYFNEDGTSTEGSSSYSILKTIWMNDIYEEIKKERINTKYAKQFNEIYFLVIRACKLIVKCTSKNAFAIGDITPDESSKDIYRKMKKILDSNEFIICPKLLNDGSILYSNYGNSYITLSKIKNRSYHPVRDHSHLDISSITWVNNDKPIIVDPGRYSYDKRYEFIKQKTFHGHNVPVIKGERDQQYIYLMNSPMTKSLALRKDSTEINSSNKIKYYNSSQSIIHEREIDLSMYETIIIIDKFTCKRKIGTILLYWHLHPNITKDNIVIDSKMDLGLRVKISDYYFSEEYGESVRSNKLEINIETNLSSIAIRHELKYINQQKLIYNKKIIQ